MSANLYCVIVYCIVVIGGLLACLIHDHLAARHRNPYGAKPGQAAKPRARR
jgi:hypothetical protein